MENTLVQTNYPVLAFMSQFLEMVSENKVSSICAHTGAGKSTILPIHLLKEGYSYIVIAVPSRAAAVTLASRVAKLLNTEVGDIVGYHTAYERASSQYTRIMYTTDGLELMKQLHGRNTIDNSILIIDELQEWPINVEALVAWVHRKIQKGWNTKVILMSATMDVAKVSKYFGNAPYLMIPGKLYDIKESARPESELVTTISDLASKGRNVLTFLPGKREIDKTYDKLNEMELDAVILKLHGDLPLCEQELVFKSYDKPVIVLATNIAQNSITIPYIDAVVDSGLERRMEIIDGLESLVVGLISHSDYIQRKGRAGRTKPGEYVWCNDTSISSLDEYPTPEIQTGCINQIVLKLASIDVNATEVEFFHQPPTEKILTSQKTLRILGALDEHNQITEIGKVMAQLPLSVRHARMIVESQKRGVLEDMIDIVALAEFGGIKQSIVPYRKFSREVRSDLLAELDCFNVVKGRMYTNDNPFDGIIEKNYFRVLELRTKLYDILECIYGEVTSTGDRNAMIRACASGLVEFLYVHENNGWYSNPSDPWRRKINFNSAVLPSKYILGLPHNISLRHKQNNGQDTLYLISSALMVDQKILMDVAPHMVHLEERKEFNYDRNEYLSSTITMFGNIEIGSNDERVNTNSEKRAMLIEWLATKTFDEDWKGLDSKLVKVLARNCDRLGTFEEAKEFYLRALEKAYKNTLPNMRKVKNFSFLSA